jgi:hypothetical protein
MPRNHMAISKRKRKLASIKGELLKKSREAALAAVQIFNNPNITFKSESYVVLMIIAWTYLVHAYYRQHRIDYRYFEQKYKRRRFDRTSKGAYKYWELERCLNNDNSPIDKDTANNLRFLIGLRHEIEHQMTTHIDNIFSARFQACCLNYNFYIKKLFGDEFGIDKHLSFSLQFSTIDASQKNMLEEHKELPVNIQSYIQNFDDSLSDDEYASPKFAYRVLFVQKTANRKGQADKVIEFIKADSPLAEAVNKEYAVIKEAEKKKLLAKQIVSMIKSEGFAKFNTHHHAELWKSMDAKNIAKGYGSLVAEKHWYWYESWLQIVRDHCLANKAKYI